MPIEFDFSNPITLVILGYIAAISIISVIVCCYDKVASKHLTKHRTRERTLLLLSALGGSVAMLITMLIVRHKTKHVKCMLGIPLILIAQIALTVALLLIR